MSGRTARNKAGNDRVGAMVEPAQRPIQKSILQATDPTTARNSTSVINRVVLIRTATQSICRRLRYTRFLHLSSGFTAVGGTPRIVRQVGRGRRQVRQVYSRLRVRDA
jgi:hypothetical protein